MCNKLQICHFYDTAVSQQVGILPRQTMYASFLSTLFKPTVIQKIAKVAKMKAQATGVAFQKAQVGFVELFLMVQNFADRVLHLS